MMVIQKATASLFPKNSSNVQYKIVTLLQMCADVPSRWNQLYRGRAQGAICVLQLHDAASATNIVQHAWAFEKSIWSFTKFNIHQDGLTGGHLSYRSLRFLESSIMTVSQEAGAAIQRLFESLLQWLLRCIRFRLSSLPSNLTCNAFQDSDSRKCFAAR